MPIVRPHQSPTNHDTQCCERPNVPDWMDHHRSFDQRDLIADHLRNVCPCKRRECSGRAITTSIRRRRRQITVFPPQILKFRCHRISDHDCRSIGDAVDEVDRGDRAVGEQVQQAVVGVLVSAPAGDVVLGDLARGEAGKDREGRAGPVVRCEWVEARTAGVRELMGLTIYGREALRALADLEPAQPHLPRCRCRSQTGQAATVG